MFTEVRWRSSPRLLLHALQICIHDGVVHANFTRRRKFDGRWSQVGSERGCRGIVCGRRAVQPQLIFRAWTCQQNIRGGLGIASPLRLQFLDDIVGNIERYGLLSAVHLAA